ncbi:hypothetical protein [Streptomyces sp. 4F14]|uniref:hypothetical protein n=1 Tax=Streptomyces sp. 4F14 TaxID=3394380 RepID=UPI003A892A84
MAEQPAPAMERALADEDPVRGLAALLETTLAMASRERDVLAAAKNSGALGAEVGGAYFDALMSLVRRGQQAGTLRADIVPDDIPRLVAMLLSVLWNMDPDTEDWRRYIALLLDFLSPTGARPLPPLTRAT